MLYLERPTALVLTLLLIVFFSSRCFVSDSVADAASPSFPWPAACSLPAATWHLDAAILVALPRKIMFVARLSRQKKSANNVRASGPANPFGHLLYTHTHRHRQYHRLLNCFFFFQFELSPFTRQNRGRLCCSSSCPVYSIQTSPLKPNVKDAGCVIDVVVHVSNAVFIMILDCLVSHFVDSIRKTVNNEKKRERDKKQESRE